VPGDVLSQYSICTMKDFRNQKSKYQEALRHSKNVLFGKRKRIITIGAYVLLCALGVAIVGLLFFIIRGNQVAVTIDAPVAAVVPEEIENIEFPVGVNPGEKQILESDEVDAYFEKYISKDVTTGSHTSWFHRALGKLALMNWYQNLASLSSKILVIQSGERKEQVANNFAKILNWSDDEKQSFVEAIESSAPELTDGKFFPGTYTVSRGATVDDVVPLVLKRFDEEVLKRYTDTVAESVPLHDALIIASLLEREAYDFTDMRQISGVIWNRLFDGMRLQLDATLQYAKGTHSQDSWWPIVRPSDKYIASAFNTYENIGLPPAPIANPSLEAILAALNPRKTDCMYYFHDKKAGFHCSETYEEHVQLLKQYYGRGK
jgi:hypothetical protein